MSTTKKSSASAAKKNAARKAPAKKAAAKKAAAMKSTANKSTANKSTANKSTANKSTANKSTAKKAAAMKSTAKKAPATKPAAEKASAKKAAAMKNTTKKRAAKKVAAEKSPFGKKFNDEMKQRLQVERAKYLHSEEIYRAEAEALIEGREPGDVQFDEESGEGDTLAVERERDLALSAQARVAVDQIDAALDRIAAGTYGICVVSGLRIPQERLRAIPWAAERVEYKVGSLQRR